MAGRMNLVDSLGGLAVPPASRKSNKDIVKWVWGGSVHVQCLVTAWSGSLIEGRETPMMFSVPWTLQDFDVSVIAAGYNVQYCAQKLIDVLELIQIMVERNLKRHECPPYTLRSAHDFPSIYQSSTTFELETCLWVFLHFSIQLRIY